MCAKMLMFSFSLFPVLISWIGVVAEEEVSSPLRVAQCRATCLQKVSLRIKLEASVMTPNPSLIINKLMMPTKILHSYVKKNFVTEKIIINAAHIFSSKNLKMPSLRL